MLLRASTRVAWQSGFTSQLPRHTRAFTSTRFLREEVGTDVAKPDVAKPVGTDVAKPYVVKDKKDKRKPSMRNASAKVQGLMGASDFNAKSQLPPRNFRGIDIEKECLLDNAIEQYGLTDELKKDIFRVSSFELASDKEIIKRRIKNVVKKYERFEGDTGSSEVQVAVLSERISWLRELMATFKKNMVTKRALEKYFHRRRTLMMYLKRERFDKYNLMLVDYNITEAEIWEWGHIPGRKKHLSRYRRVYCESKYDKAKREQWDEEAKVKASKEAKEIAQ